MADLGTGYQPRVLALDATQFADNNTYYAPAYDWDAYGLTHLPPLAAIGSAGGPVLPSWGQLFPLG